LFHFKTGASQINRHEHKKRRLPDAMEAADPSLEFRRQADRQAATAVVTVEIKRASRGFKRLDIPFIEQVASVETD
jgi:hypothetical protein